MHRRASRHRYSLLRSWFPGTRKNGPCFGRIALSPSGAPLVRSRRSVNKITTARVFSQTRAEASSSSSSSSPSASSQSHRAIRARDRHFMGVLSRASWNLSNHGPPVCLSNPGSPFLRDRCTEINDRRFRAICRPRGSLLDVFDGRAVTGPMPQLLSIFDFQSFFY